MSKRLGRGLDSLFTPDLEIKEDDLIQEISVKDLRPNPYQPRKNFSEEALLELKISIQQHGIVQPIIVRKSIRGYEIVSGERRFRAAKLAQWEHVPVVIRDFDDGQMMEIALIENVQREDLNSMEIAYAYQKLITTLAVTQEFLAERLGKSRSHLTNFLRLLQLPPEIQEYVSRGTLSMGHARALLSVTKKDLQKKIAKKVIQEKASVRQCEEWIKSIKKEPIGKQKNNDKKSTTIKHYQDLLQQIFSTSVKIKQGKKRGRIEIEYYSERELERLMDLLNNDQLIK